MRGFRLTRSLCNTIRSRPSDSFWCFNPPPLSRNGSIMASAGNPPTANRPIRRPFRAAVLRGLGGLLPPLLTVVLIVALYGMVREYVLLPLENSANWILASWQARSIVAGDADEDSPPDWRKIEGKWYRRASDGRYVPERIFATVRNEEGLRTAESYTARRLCERYVDYIYLRGYLTMPALLAIFVLAMYFLGKLLSGAFCRWPGAVSST